MNRYIKWFSRDRQNRVYVLALLWSLVGLSAWSGKER